MSETVVETSLGKLRGAIDRGLHVFQGVRYAETTAASNRFCRPQSPRAWAGVRDALAWGASAPQVEVAARADPFFAWYFAIQPVSEDCLFLNVFSPGPGAGKRPVMVWIHGGGWRECSGTAPGFDGTNLARAEDVVVVTLNHRLNAFGYLHLEDADERFADSGNAGLLDLVMALAWVRDNAAAFGGDPDNVTVFGESGGASKIAALLAMPAAKGLFHKAIIQSSGGGLRLASPEDAARQTALLAKALGRDRLRGEELQALPMGSLIAALKTFRGAFRGMIDGRSFERDAFHPAAPPTSAHVPVMAGCTDTEASFYLRNDPGSFSLGWDEVTRRLVRFLEIDRSGTTKILSAYRAVHGDGEPSEIMIAIASDYIFKRNTLRIAGLQAASASAPVYAYQFDRRTPVEEGRFGAPHTSEVPFIFGTTSAAAAQVGTGDDIEPVTTLMMAAWGAFARNGDPNNSLMPRWTPYDASSRQVMRLNRVCRLDVDPGGKARAALDALPYFGYGHSIPAFARS